MGSCTSSASTASRSSSFRLSHLLDVLRFDNTYSFVHAKKVSFTVEVLLPDEGMQKYDEELTPI